MKRVLDRLKYVWPTFMFVILIGCFIYPYIDGVSAIFFPPIARYLCIVTFFRGFFVVRLIVSVIFLAHCTYFVFAFIRKWSTLYKVTIAISLVVLPALWFTWTYRRISAFPFGGRMCVMRAGGASKIIEEALELVDSATDSISPRLDWPKSIKALGASFVEVKKEARIVNVEIPRFNTFAAQFGFFIQDVNLPPPKITDSLGEPVYRQWRLADGIYLYEH